ncbi:MAG: polysaccharide deacetylase family protein [Bacteroidales bacterium]|nr:polysaccharide deacetylase family protein [Bacteroidales bacterium]
MSTFSRFGLPILMYHKVSDSGPDGLTVTADMLELELAYLSEKGYETISFLDLRESVETGKELPKRPVIITFDDAYENFRTHALPILKKFRMKTALFVPVAFMGKTNLWDQGSEKILSADELKRIEDDGLIELGIHGFLHRSYAELAPEDMREDLENCFNTMEFHHIRISRVLAYPYGGYPKKDPELNLLMKKLFTEMQLWFAVRIGNRINPLPVKDNYELKRIDIKGTDSFRTFRTKLAHGRRNPFA